MRLYLYEPSIVYMCGMDYEMESPDWIKDKWSFEKDNWKSFRIKSL